MKARAFGGVVVLALAMGSLSGCDYPSSTTGIGCASWAELKDPSAAADAAEAVVIGRVVEQAGSGSFLEAPVDTWRIDVTEWVKGGAGDPEIVVTPAIDNCGDKIDPLADVDRDTPIALFLYEEAGNWVMLNPFQGLVELDAAGEIPAEWPADRRP